MGNEGQMDQPEEVKIGVGIDIYPISISQITTVNFEDLVNDQGFNQEYFHSLCKMLTEDMCKVLTKKYSK